MEENEMTEETLSEETEPEVEEEPVAAVEEPPPWDFPTFTQTPAAPQTEDPGIYDSLKAEAASEATKAISGLLQNQSSLRNTLTRQGASPETIALAEATLLSMDPRVMIQPGAAQIAAALAIGQSTMSGKSWKAAPPPSIPPAAFQPGKENPSQTPPEVEKELADFNRAFKNLGITSDLLNEVDA